jgi:hypothetical protein
LPEGKSTAGRSPDKCDEPPNEGREVYHRHQPGNQCDESADGGDCGEYDQLLNPVVVGIAFVDLHKHEYLVGVFGQRHFLFIVVVHDYPEVVEFREVGLVEGHVDALANVPRRWVLTGLDRTDVFGEVAHRFAAGLAEPFENEPPPIVP